MTFFLVTAFWNQPSFRFEPWWLQSRYLYIRYISELVTIKFKVDQRVFIAWQVHYYNYNIIWIIENSNILSLSFTQTFGGTVGLNTAGLVKKSAARCCQSACIHLVFIGPHSCNLPWSHMITSVGKQVTGFSTLIANQDENGEGEVTERFIL